MGLDTSHDCWHGPYSMFMEWREKLHRYVAPNPDNTLQEAWQRKDYNDPDGNPIHFLMVHSDCDGDIPADKCIPMADALQKILDVMPERAMYDCSRSATERFIKGLRLAASKGESVDFH